MTVCWEGLEGPCCDAPSCSARCAGPECLLDVGQVHRQGSLSQKWACLPSCQSARSKFTLLCSIRLFSSIGGCDTSGPESAPGCVVLLEIGLLQGSRLVSSRTRKHFYWALTGPGTGRTGGFLFLTEESLAAAFFCLLVCDTYSNKPSYSQFIYFLVKQQNNEKIS